MLRRHSRSGDPGASTLRRWSWPCSSSAWRNPICPLRPSANGSQPAMPSERALRTDHSSPNSRSRTPKTTPYSAAKSRVTTRFEILLERGSVEKFINHGEISSTRFVLPKEEGLSLKTEGGIVKIHSTAVYRLNSTCRKGGAGFPGGISSQLQSPPWLHSGDDYGCVEMPHHSYRILRLASTLFTKLLSRISTITPSM